MDFFWCLMIFCSQISNEFQTLKVLLPLTKNKNCFRNNMRTDHEELCGTSYGSFCLNGGICYMIPTVSSPFCRYFLMMPTLESGKERNFTFLLNPSAIGSFALLNKQHLKGDSSNARYCKAVMFQLAVLSSAKEARKLPETGKRKYDYCVKTGGMTQITLKKCIENYTGARCEEVLLPNIKSQTKGDLFAAFLASLLLLGVLVIGAFYFLCRKAAIPRTSSSECGANLVETTSSNGCNKITTA